MPDSKNSDSIRHLSNVASMHQNLLVSVQQIYNKQFKAVMKAHSKEINYVKDEMTKLREDKEKYSKLKYKSKQIENNDDGTSEKKKDMAHSDAFKLLKKRNQLVNKNITEKVRKFSVIDTLDETSDDTVVNSIESQESTEAKTSKHFKPGNSRRPISQLESIEEEGAQNGEQKTYSPTAKLNRIDNFRHGFESDRYVNSVVINARAKLVALYQQSILGPQSHQKVLKQAPATPDTRLRYKSRSQSAVIKREPTVHQAKEERKAGSARFASRHLTERHTALVSRTNSRESQRSQSSTNLDNGGSEADRQFRIRQDILSNIKDSLSEKYLKFEAALHRRMMIREIKAAEYDVNHGTTSVSGVLEILPSKSHAMSSALRKQSAFIALERNFLGPVGITA